MSIASSISQSPLSLLASFFHLLASGVLLRASVAPVLRHTTGLVQPTCRIFNCGFLHDMSPESSTFEASDKLKHFNMRLQDIQDAPCDNHITWANRRHTTRMVLDNKRFSPVPQHLIPADRCTGGVARRNTTPQDHEDCRGKAILDGTVRFSGTTSTSSPQPQAPTFGIILRYPWHVIPGLLRQQ